jgi:hypothetical protein
MQDDMVILQRVHQCFDGFISVRRLHQWTAQQFWRILTHSWQVMSSFAGKPALSLGSNWANAAHSYWEERGALTERSR